MFSSFLYCFIKQQTYPQNVLKYKGQCTVKPLADYKRVGGSAVGGSIG